MKEGEKEYIKEAIVTIRVFAALLVTGIFGAAGFIVSHLEEINLIQAIMSVAGLLILGFLLGFISRLFFKMMDELRRLQ